MRVCPQCGARYEDDAGFCAMDGSALGELSPSVSAPAGSSAFPRFDRATSSTGFDRATSSTGFDRATSSTGVAAPPVSSVSNSALRWQPSGPTSTAALVEDPIEDGSLEPEESLIGVVLGDRYRIEERIGAGGMGLVYRATHVLIGRPLAVKVLRRRYATQTDIALRFAQEARIASSIKHPNVVDIIDYGSTPEASPYYVMEFLAGRSLAQEIRSGGPVEPSRALGIAVQITHGLAAAHQAGIVHRDLKPDNVYLVPSTGAGAPEQVKILDFGIARVAGRKTRLTAAGVVVGTPEYMSPEQARGDDLDGRSDLYALGIVLFELLTGQVPFSADSMVGTLTKQVFELAPQIREIDPRFAGYPSIEAGLTRLLAKNRDERPATALDAATLLQTAAANDLEVVDERRERAAVEGWSTPRSGSGPQPDRARRSTIMIGSGAITSAHSVTEAEGPATGSFAAKRGPEPAGNALKRPSVIIADGPISPGPGRPARVLQVAHVVPAPVVEAGGQSALSKTPTPTHGTPRLGKRPRGRFDRRHLPLVLIGLGAAIFAALVTIGFVRWWQRSEGGRANVTGMNGSCCAESRRFNSRSASGRGVTPAPETASYRAETATSLDGRYQTRDSAFEAGAGRDRPNTSGQRPVVGPARVSEHSQQTCASSTTSSTLGRPRSIVPGNAAPPKMRYASPAS